MKKILKWDGIILLFILIFVGYRFYKFADRALNGVEDYDYERPELRYSDDQPNILIFTKTNGYIHKASIEASLPALEELCVANQWHMIHTDNGAAFNSEDLAKIDVVIWNNTSGPVLTGDQQAAMRSYILSGGGFIGIHAAGDGSHKWRWYREEIIGAEYSHHPLHPQIQVSSMDLECDTTSLINCSSLSASWDRPGEWYIFEDNPRDQGQQVLYTMDESRISTDGSLYIVAKDKINGMGDDHPIVWYKENGRGRTFYSAIGHTTGSWEEQEHLDILKQAILWTGRIEE